MIKLSMVFLMLLLALSVFAGEFSSKASSNLGNLGFLVQVSGQEIQCTSSRTCQNQGFDCCLEGLCVTDGEERPEASGSPYYDQAMADVREDPMNYIYWPEIFYVCPSILPRPFLTSR